MIGKLFAPLAMKISGGIILALALYAGLLNLQLAAEKRHSAHWEKRSGEWQAAHAKLESETRTKTALAQAQDAAHAKAVEARDLKRAMETNDALRKDIAAVRARLERLRAGATTADPGSGSAAGVSTPAGSTPSLAGAGGGAFIPTDDLRICAENTLKAKAAREFLLGMRNP